MATTPVSSASELKAALAAAKAGDTILVKSGNYGWVTLENFKFSDYVTIKSADGKGGAVFKHIGLNNTSHIRLDSLTVEFGPTTPQLHHLKAIEVRKSDHLQVVNSEIIGYAGTKDWKDVPRGIHVWDGSSNIELINNHFHHFSRAIVIQSISDINISGNLIDNIHSDGIFFSNSKEVIVQDNLLTDFYRTGSVHADYIQFDPGTAGASRDVIIRGNVMLKGDGNGDVQGIFGGVHHLDVIKKGFANFLVENNIYFDSGRNAIQFHTGENMIIRNNTVLADPVKGQVVWIRLTGPQSNSLIENNVALQVNAEGGSTASDNIIVQFRDATKANHYSKLFLDPFADPATLADLAPKPGTSVGYGSGKGAEKLFQELLGGGAPDPVNTAPVAEDDSAVTQQGAAVTIKVLSNDWDADDNALTVSSVGTAGYGTVKLNTNGTVSYTPAAGFAGSDRFTYTVSDGKGGSDSATVSVTVAPVVPAPGASIMIDAGGGSDHGFSGGRTATTTTSIAGTDQDVLYQSERYGTFSYAVPVENGSHDVTLHFAEIYWNAAGKRLFDVKAEGELILDDFDIFTAAGGKNKAYDVTLPVTVEDGILNLDFITIKDNASVVAIEIAPAPAPSAAIAINAGGGSAHGHSADYGFSGGRTATTTASIAGTDQDVLYQSERYGTFSYAVPVENGSHDVTLHFAEIYWNAAGKRLFDVKAEGELILDDFDIFTAAGGKNKAYDVTLPVTVEDGILNLDFITIKDNASVVAIEIDSLLV